ncbi:ATP-binding cassette domain-containing protein [Moritella viscosa]|uniref:ABC transporter, ATP-binding protein, putative n=1 Tax=Moritella viscosa TaxID=80854 RepID=A0A1L0A3U8_9GAMM|nr:ATP-binding cassette domain-containing protein [Moritella viscosa]SGZ08621.1 ABC transporter, ATP-binding protein, putative [Moritella viscosa]SHO10560.1 ABC transporter, ATP-binding protein, putative [Moritella viscosa]SHO10561.1 ABC transporter, ATP-binding protein, putative [Moritella viscosa]SHO15732.1 ABC transporter, ATP-binding protein, putative [Moritella viscosa]SHO17522.1 ABC transporter, ATP-binding protein, putative [Moritella viscosa]
MSLSVNNLTILDNRNQPLFVPVSFTVAQGEIFTLMGPSGCGKSSLLSVIAGHTSADFSYQGECYYQQQLLNNLPAEKRNIGILFQDDLLFPHLNIWENLAIALPNKVKKAQRKLTALETLTQLNLLTLADKTPMQISGGQRARISMMRMLLAEPAVVLLDEPFSKLDKSLRSEFRKWVFTQTISRQLPVLMVTHDADDVPNGSKCLHWPWNKENKNA